MAERSDGDEAEQGIDKSGEGVLDLDEFAHSLESFNRFYIRLPGLNRVSFTTLSVLHNLSRTSPMRLRELTRTEQVTQPAITQLVTRLEQDGLVRRGADPTDGRAVLVHITEAGRAVIRARHTDRISRLIPLFAQLSEPERQAVAAALPVLRRLAELGAASG